MRLFAGFLLIFVLGLPAVRAQQLPALINLDVIAVDGKGVPVSGLKAEDFQITDNGKARSIVWLHEFPQRARAARSEASDPPASGDVATNHVATNQGAADRKTADRGATFIVVDLFNADLAARGLTANEVEHTLEKLETADNVYLYLLTPAAKIFMVHGIGATTLPGRPSGARPEGNDGPWTRQIKPLLENALRQVTGFKAQDDRFPQLRIQPTWQAMGSMLSQIAVIPGPKSLVWITQGIQNAYVTPGREIQIDTTPIRTFAENLNALETAAYTVQQKPSGGIQMQSTGSPGDTLQQLSLLTGGRAFPSDTTDQAINAAIGNTTKVNYRLVFQPEKLDGKYHKLKVTIGNKEVKLQTAQTYYAVPSSGGQIDEAILSSAGGSPFEFPEIGLTATAAKAGDQLHLSVRVDPRDILFLKQNGRYQAALAVDLVEYTVAGAKPAGQAQQVNLDLSEDDYAKAVSGGIEIPNQTALDASAQRARLIVLDRNTKLTGTVTMPVGNLAGAAGNPGSPR